MVNNSNEFNLVFMQFDLSKKLQCVWHYLLVYIYCTCIIVVNFKFLKLWLDKLLWTLKTLKTLTLKTLKTLKILKFKYFKLKH